MPLTNKYTGFAVAIAWPETYCKQPGSWYDGITGFLGANKNHYYKAGHAALVLIDPKGTCSYYDFGRYHTPFKHGRVRSAHTDCELKMHTQATFSPNGKTLLNLDEILKELQNNPACHGEGTIYAGVGAVDLEKARAKADLMQEQSPIPYGPFKMGGSNCSRFVYEAIYAGKPKFWQRFKLRWVVPLGITPTPMSNVKALAQQTSMAKLLKNVPFFPNTKLSLHQQCSTLKEPNKPKHLPAQAQWLSGEGCGSWFVIHSISPQLKVSRYSPEGNLECTEIYEHKEVFRTVNPQDLKVSYSSNCALLSLKLKDTVYRCHKISN